MEIEEQWIADAVKYLLNTGEETAALLLLDCSLKLKYEDTVFPLSGEGSVDLYTIGIECSTRHYDVLSNKKHEITSKIEKSLSLTQPDDLATRGVYYPILKQEKHPENWRDQYKEAVLGQMTNNQGLPEDKSGKYNRYTWNNFELGSKAELAIAKELDKRNVIFFPNSKARIKLNNSSCNIIPDFIICYNGKWGILQCDHESTHPYAAKDHEKDRCVKHPQDIVDEFLQLLDKNG